MAITKTSPTTLITNTTTVVRTPTAVVSTKTASISTTKITPQQITVGEQIDANVTERLTSVTEAEDNRSVIQDKQRLNTAQITIRAIASIQRAQEAAQTTAVAISTTDAPVNRVPTILAQKTAIPSNKNRADIQRTTQKNQRTCNHQFSLITKKCNLCGRDRNSHVYDV